MKFTPKYLNRFLLFKIPVAWLAGIRVKETNEQQTVLQVRHGRINQNPFGSVYFAVLVMGGELATGIPLFKAIAQRNENISMLVVRHQSDFFKKATGKIRFVFNQNEEIRQALKQLKQAGDHTRFVLTSKAVNEQGETVAGFSFEWSLKKRG